MEMGGIGLRRETIRPALAEPPFVLPHRRATLRVPVLAKAIRLVDFGPTKGVRALTGRAPKGKDALGCRSSRSCSGW